MSEDEQLRRVMELSGQQSHGIRIQGREIKLLKKYIIL
jgi:hypothetical protein